MPRLSSVELLQLATDVLTVAGASPDAAAVTAADLLYAEASGVASHGLL